MNKNKRAGSDSSRCGRVESACRIEIGREPSAGRSIENRKQLFELSAQFKLSQFSECRFGENNPQTEVKLSVAFEIWL